ncbi:hypothetical protein ABL57_09305 [Kocuria sp. SM24M-10]|nr:hypothetical protein ABL57_09305 [Kocuria sp. SM24M-10]
MSTRLPRMSTVQVTPANTDRRSLGNATVCSALHTIAEDRQAVVRSPIHLFLGNGSESATDASR